MVKAFTPLVPRSGHGELTFANSVNSSYYTPHCFGALFLVQIKKAEFKMKFQFVSLVILALLVQVSFADIPTTDPVADLGAGSTLTVQVQVDLPANVGTLVFEGGAISSGDASKYQCTLEFSSSIQERYLQAGRVLTISSVSVDTYGDATLTVSDDGTISSVICHGTWNGDANSYDMFAIGDVQTALQGVFTLTQFEVQGN
jgi:hypothetical protein